MLIKLFFSFWLYFNVYCIYFILNILQQKFPCLQFLVFIAKIKFFYNSMCCYFHFVLCLGWGAAGSVFRSWLLPVPSSFFQPRHSGAGVCAGLFALSFMVRFLFLLSDKLLCLIEVVFLSFNGNTCVFSGFFVKRKAYLIPVF